MRPSAILTRKRRSRIKRGFELPLTSMMDMLVIILVFMLKSFSANSTALNTSSRIQMPVSLSPEFPGDGANLIIEPEGITFDNERILNFTTLPDPAGRQSPGQGYTFAPEHLSDGGHRIVPLFDALVRSREKTEHIMAKAHWKTQGHPSPSSPPFPGVLMIQADKSLRYEVMQKVLFSAGAAGYKVFKFVAIQNESR